MSLLLIWIVHIVLCMSLSDDHTIKNDLLPLLMAFLLKYCAIIEEDAYRV